MAEVLSKAIGLICIILLGYILKRVGFFGPKDYVLVSKIVFNITFPATIIASFSNFIMDSSLLWLIVIGLACNLLMSGIGYLITLKKSADEKAFYMINLAGYNIGCYTLPFIQNFLGPAGVVMTCMFDTGNSIMCTGTTYAIAKGVTGKNDTKGIGGILKTLFASIPFDVYIIMLILTSFQVRMPEFVVSISSTIGVANVFLAMFMVGMMFEMNIKKEYIKDAVVIILLRYGVAAVLSVLVYFVSPFSLEIRQVLVILLCGPIPAMAPVSTEKCKGNVALSSMVNSITIVLSTVIITTLLAVMDIT